MTDEAGLLREAAQAATLCSHNEPFCAEMLALRAALAVAQVPAQHVHHAEYPSRCEGCEHLAAALVRGAPAWMLPEAQKERLDVATWRLSNAASSLARHAAHADDPAHRSWFPSAIADVEREVRLARAAAGPEPDYTAAKGSRHDP